MSANIKASVDGTHAIIGVGGVDQMTVSNAGVVTANSFVGAISAGNISSSTAIATGSTTARTLANRFADVVNVKDFGAVGDGTNPAATTTAIQNALAEAKLSNKALYFPSGTYLTSGIDITLDQDGLTIFGDGESSVLQKITFVCESDQCSISNLLVDNINKDRDGIVIGNANGRADRLLITNVRFNYCDYGIRYQYGAFNHFENCYFWFTNTGILGKSFDPSVAPLSNGGCVFDNVTFWHATYSNVYIQGVGEYKFADCGFYDSGLQNIKIEGNEAEKAIQIYFTNCSATLGHDNRTTRSKTAITSVINNGSGKVRVNFAVDSMPYIFEGYTVSHFDFGGVYPDGQYAVTNVTPSSVDIEALNYTSTTTGTFYHGGWQLYIDNSTISSLNTYDIYITGGNINSVYVGNSANVSFVGCSIPHQLFADKYCRSLLRIGTAYGRRGSDISDSSVVPISGPNITASTDGGWWTEVTNWKDEVTLEYGSVMRTPVINTPYSGGIAVDVNEIKSTGFGVFINGGLASAIEFSLGNDTATSFNIPNKLNGMISIMTISGGQPFLTGSGIIAMDCGNVPETVKYNGGSALEIVPAGGTLTGTTGNAGKITVSSYINGVFYVENRTGGGKSFVIKYIN